MKSRYKLIIFDLDGTIIDTMGGFADIAGDLIAKNYNWSFEEGRKKYLETSGIPFFQQLELLFPKDHKNENTAGLFERRKIECFIKESISEKTLETFHHLKDLGLRTAISSNNFHQLVKEFVHRENVPVDLALGFHTGFAKGLQHFKYLEDYFNITFSQMLFVGDSLKDAEIAFDNNISFVAKTGTFTEMDFKLSLNSKLFPVIAELHEITTVLEES